MIFRKTSQGNYRCWYKGFYIFIWKKPHGAWAGVIELWGAYIDSEGLFGTSMPTLNDVRNWILGKPYGNNGIKTDSAPSPTPE